MYYVCKFSGTWSAFEGKTRISKLLEPDDVELIQRLFGPALRPEAILDAILVCPISSNKIPPGDKAFLPGTASTFYICKCASVWILYDSTTKKDRVLTPAEINMVKRTFAGSINENAIVVALLIVPISPNKLQQVTSRAPSPAKEKSAEASKSTSVAA